MSDNDAPDITPATVRVSGGTVGELTPSNGRWIFGVLYSLAAPSHPSGPDDRLAMYAGFVATVVSLAARR